MKRFLLVLSLPVVLAACNPSAPSAAKDQSLAQSQKQPVLTKEEMSIGDIEYNVHMNGTLDERSKAPNVTENRLDNPRKYVDLDTISVKPPFPRELWVSFGFLTDKNFPDAPALLRAKVYVDDQVIDTFPIVVGPSGVDAKEPRAYNVLEKMSAPPTTLLVRIEAEALLLAKGTDPATIDPATATAPESRRGSIRSNPIRINFVSENAP